MAMTLRGMKNVGEKKIVDMYVSDMQASQEKGKQTAISNELLPYLAGKVEKGAKNEFFLAMYDKLMNGYELTENMVNAVRKCMKQDAEREAQKDQPVDESKLPVKSFKVKQWWMKQNNLDSRVITGAVLRETSKAYLIKGHADMLENTCFCVRCGRELTEPASQITGMGVVCADKAGVPYDPTDVMSASPAKRKKIREQFITKLHNQQFEAWVPKSQIEEEYEAPKKAEKKPATKKAPAKKASAKKTTSKKK